jgi:hypothetical protein
MVVMFDIAILLPHRAGIRTRVSHLPQFATLFSIDDQKILADEKRANNIFDR